MTMTERREANKLLKKEIKPITSSSKLNYK